MALHGNVPEGAQGFCLMDAAGLAIADFAERALELDATPGVSAVGRGIQATCRARDRGAPDRQLQKRADQCSQVRVAHRSL